MTNKNVIDILQEKCNATAPDRFGSLSYEDAEKYRNTVPKVSVKRSYIKAVAIYAAACIVVLIAIPFIIGGGEDTPGITPGNTVGSSTEPVVTESERVDNIVPADDTVMQEFLAALDKAYDEGRIVEKHDKKECVEVTTEDVLRETGARVFTFANNYYTYIFADGEVYGIFRNGQLHSVPGMITCDYDENGKQDILLSVSWIDKTLNERTSFYFFDTETKTDGPRCKILPGQRTVRREISDYGTVRYFVTDVSYFVDTDRRFVMLPVSGDTVYGHLDFDEKNIELIDFDPAREKIIPALEKGVAEGRLPDRPYENYDILVIREYKDTVIFRFDQVYIGAFIYIDGEVYNFGEDLPVYLVSAVQKCDPDKNGNYDYLIYGSWGSGVYGQSIIYFDSSYKKADTLYLGVYPASVVNIVEDSDSYIINVFGEAVGTLEYDNGIRVNLDQDASISDAIIRIMKKEK